MRYKFFFAVVFAFLVLVPSQTVFAGNSTTITRGAPMPNISWSVGGAPGCTTTSSYPNLADGIVGQWIGFSPGTGFGTFSFSGNVYAPAGSYDFTCTAGAVSDTATLNVNDCSAPATWNGTACAMPAPPAPSISSFTAIPNNHGAGGGNSTLAWSVSNATSCWASNGWSGWVSASGSSQAVFVGSTTTYNLECWNGVGVSSGIASVTVTVAVAPIPAALHICPSSATVVALGVAQNLKAWYTPTGTSFVSCANTTGAIDRTVNVTWTSSFPARASVGVNTGIVNGLTAGGTTITANDLANGVSSTAPITVTGACVPDVCGNHAAEAANTCTGDTFTLVRGCSLPNTSCPGTRPCDYNWKEVAP